MKIVNAVKSKLADVILWAIAAKLEESAEQVLRDAADQLETAVDDAINDKLASAIEDAMGETDIERLVSDAVKEEMGSRDFERSLDDAMQSAVDDAIGELDVEKLVADAVEEADGVDEDKIRELIAEALESGNYKITRG